ncbi:ABC transporter permease [Lachnoclostridium phytofermentans]|uniref:Membrane protein, putative n=1 Tax=Lachnoclostridium phytofermentans (strain ATCC 700394 / DSM 18823 / ISDg) TaxID=357809 RepID=A9KNB8_LACP7|nr:ABC transporter permease [Lachnoclostridium phytofermentans]ABX43035.1 membrane protein, putative [Lachnoclostridium phytofermentans ISDg]
MRIYLSIFRIRIINSLQYRTVAFGEIITRFFWGLMEILAFSALYRSGQSNFSMDFSQTVSYIWMQQVLFVLFLVVFGDGEIYSTIRSGSIAYELVRPMSLYNRWFCQSASNRIAPTILNCMPVLLLASIMPKPYKISLPVGLGQFLLFLLSSVLALGVVVAFTMLMYITLFYTLSHRGIKIIVTALTTFLSGGVIPLPFFPEPTLTIVKILPFAAMQNMPLLIFSGSIMGMDVLKGIALQIFWLVALIFIGQLAMRHALKNVVVQGG